MRPTPLLDYSQSELNSYPPSAATRNEHFDRKFFGDPPLQISHLVVSTKRDLQGSNQLERSLGFEETGSVPSESFVTQSSAFNNLLNSTSTCLSPTVTVTSVNTLDQSFYLSQSSVIPRIPNAPPRRRDSGINSEGSFHLLIPFRLPSLTAAFPASSDSVFMASGEVSPFYDSVFLLLIFFSQSLVIENGVLLIGTSSPWLNISEILKRRISMSQS
jgi:hypothetical protein